MIGLVALVCLGAMPRATVNVSLEAMPLPRLLAELSKQFGMQLATSQQTEKEVVTVDVKDVDPNELLKKIAQVVDGSWRKEGTLLRLTRTSEETWDEETAQRKLEIQKIQTQLDKSENQVTPITKDNADETAKKMASMLRSFSPGNNGFYQRWSQVVKGLPSKTYGTEILKAVGSANLQSAPLRISTVWSTDPYRSERQLDKSVWKVIANLSRDKAIMDDAMDRAHVGPPTVGNSTYYFDGMPQPGMQTSNQPIAKVLVKVFKQTWSTYSCEIITADQKGRVIDRMNSWLQLDPYVPVKPIPDGPNEPMLPANKDLYDRTGNLNPGAPPERLVAARSAFVDPMSKDPLAVVCSPALATWSHAEHLNLVASISDDAIMPPFLSPKPMTLKACNALAGLVWDVEDQDGWLILKPKNPALTRINRLDRKVLNGFIQMISGPEPSLENRAYYAGKMYRGSWSQLASFYQRIFSADSAAQYQDENLLSFYGTLSPEMQKLAKGEGLPYANLSADQFAALQRIIYAQYSNINFQPTQPNADYNAFYQGLLKEPTELMPNCLPSASRLKIVESTDTVAMTGSHLVTYPGGSYTRAGQVMTAEELGQSMYQQEHSDIFTWMADDQQKLNLEQLRFGSRRRLAFTFNLLPEFTVGGILDDNQMQPKKLNGIAGLPADFQAQVQKSMAQMAESYKNARPGMYQQAKPDIPPR
jgi:hypothetical protein